MWIQICCLREQIGTQVMWRQKMTLKRKYFVSSYRITKFSPHLKLNNTTTCTKYFFISQDYLGVLCGKKIIKENWKKLIYHKYAKNVFKFKTFSIIRNYFLFISPGNLLFVYIMFNQLNQQDLLILELVLTWYWGYKRTCYNITELQ